MKPTSLSDHQLDEIAQRIIKGWVVRRDSIEALIAMARERNQMVKEHKTELTATSVYGMLGQFITTP